MPERNGYSFILDWLNSEGFFIFWMVVLNFTVLRVDYEFFLYENIKSVLHEFIRFSRDVSIICLAVVLLDLFLYLLFRRIPLFHKTIKGIFIFVNVLVFPADLFTLYFYRTP